MIRIIRIPQINEVHLIGHLIPLGIFSHKCFESQSIIPESAEVSRGFLHIQVFVIVSLKSK